MVSDQLLGRIVRSNNERMRSADGRTDNPRSLEGERWDERLRGQWQTFRSEFDSFRSTGGRLPRIDDLLGESQGNDGVWSAGLLMSRGRPVPGLAERFPRTVAALAEVPGLHSALWSVLSAGTELPEHHGPNAGMLRYHLGIDCGRSSALEVDGLVVPYRDGESVLFDDTVPHAAWNRGTGDRVTLFCEIIRPVGPPASWANSAVQRLLSRDPRYSGAAARAAAWDLALNHGRSPTRSGASWTTGG